MNAVQPSDSSGPSQLTRQQLGAFVEKMVLEADTIFARTQDSSRWPVQPGSSLARDDRDTDPYHLSHAVRGGISSSAEHLHAFRTLLVGARILQPQAGFTLMRAAIETAAGAVWLLNPPDRSTRVARALQHAATDAKDGDQAAQEAGADITTPLSDRIARLQDVARAAGLAESVITTRPPGSAKIIAYAGSDPSSAFDLLLAWRICSGIAHGRNWPRLGFLRREMTSWNDETKVGEYRITSDWGQISWALGASIDVLRHACRLFDERSAVHI
jgi:hypothetical protein